MFVHICRSSRRSAEHFSVTGNSQRKKKHNSHFSCLLPPCCHRNSRKPDNSMSFLAIGSISSGSNRQFSQEKVLHNVPLSNHPESYHGQYSRQQKHLNWLSSCKLTVLLNMAQSKWRVFFPIKHGDFNSFSHSKWWFSMVFPIKNTIQEG